MHIHVYNYPNFMNLSTRFYEIHISLSSITWRHVLHNFANNGHLLNKIILFIERFYCLVENENLIPIQAQDKLQCIRLRFIFKAYSTQSYLNVLSTSKIRTYLC